MKASLIGMNDSYLVVLEWRLNTFSSDQRLNVSFSNVKLPDIAPFIGPDPLWTLDDNPLFNLSVPNSFLLVFSETL